MSEEKKVLGILGGMGPLATVDLYKKIVLLTAAENDNAHIHTLIDSDTDIADRTAAILSGGKDPLPELLKARDNLVRAGAECLIMPCNTAPYFLEPLREGCPVPFLSMLDAAAEAAAAKYPGKTGVILATRGTLATGLYSRTLEKHGVPFFEPSEEEKDVLMHLIYDIVKASRPLTEGIPLFRELLRSLKKRGADYFVLGCTELPILAMEVPEEGPFIDATLELARAAIRACGYAVEERDVRP